VDEKIPELSDRRLMHKVMGSWFGVFDTLAITMKSREFIFSNVDACLWPPIENPRERLQIIQRLAQDHLIKNNFD